MNRGVQSTDRFFSAVCFLHGRALLRDTGRPQGLLETSWGGTPIESWSSAAALAQCPGGSISTGGGDENGNDDDDDNNNNNNNDDGKDRGAGGNVYYADGGDDVDVAVAALAPEAAAVVEAPAANGPHWAAMVVPILRVGVRGVIWCVERHQRRPD